MDAPDVIGIFDELRNTEGAIRRARVVGRLWSAIRKLPADDRKEVAAVLAERYAPRVTDRLAAGRDVDPAHMLAMLRSVGRVDGDEIGEIIERLQDPASRTELLAQVAGSLQDDLAAADIDELLADPEERMAALTAAAHDLAGDLDVIEPDPVDEGQAADAHAPDEDMPDDLLHVHERPGDVMGDATQGGGPPTMSEATLAAGATPGAPATQPAEPTREADLGSDEAMSVEREPEQVVRPEPVDDAGRPERPAGGLVTGDPAPTGRGDPDARLDDAAASPTTEPGEPTVADAGDQLAELIEQIRAAPSPIVRLRLLRASQAVPAAAADAADLAHAFPDGWQRRRAVAAVLERVADDDVDTVAAAAITTLTRSSDRRWIVRTIIHREDLDAEAAAELAAATQVTPPPSRVAPER